MSDVETDPDGWLNGIPYTAESDGRYIIAARRDRFELNTIPSGVTVVLQVQHTNTTLHVQGEVAADSCLRLEIKNGRTVHLEAPIASVEVAGESFTITTTHALDMRVERPEVRFVLSPTGGDRASLTVRRQGVDAPIAVQAGSHISKLYGAGPVLIPSDVCAGLEVRLAGELSITGSGRATAVITGEVGSLKCATQLADSIVSATSGAVSVHAGIVRSEITAETAVHVIGRLSASTIRVRAPAARGGAIRIGQRRSEPPEELVYQSDSERAIDIPTGDDVDTSTLVVHGAGDVLVGRVLNSTIATEGAVIAACIRNDHAGTRHDVTAGRYLYVKEDVVLTTEAKVAASNCHVGQGANGGVIIVENLLQVLGAVDGVSIRAGELRARTANASSIAADRVQIADVDASSTLDVGGGTIGSSETQALTWAQMGDLTVARVAHLLALSGPIGRTLTVEAAAAVRVGERASTTVIWPQLGKNAQPPELVLELDSHSCCVFPSSDKQEVIISSVGSSGRIENRAGHLRLQLPEEEPTAPTIFSGGKTVVRGTFTSLTLDGTGLVVLEGETSRSDRVSAPADHENLSFGVAAGAQAFGVTGNVSLAKVDGLIAGDDDAPPRIVGLTWTPTSGAAEPRSGVLRGVDVTSIPFGHLARLADLRVLDVAPGPLMRDSKKHGRSAIGSEREVLVRNRAQWYDELADHAGAHALDGQARSALAWARHRIHHRRLLLRRHPFEWLARSAHRCVGYGYRVGPAAAMLLGVVLTLSLWSIPQGCRQHVLSQFDDPSTPAIEGSATANAFCIDKSESVITEFLSAAGSVLVSPAKIVRVSDQSAPLVYWTPTVNTAATIVLTVVVIFTLLAARNYLRVRPLGE